MKRNPFSKKQTTANVAESAEATTQEASAAKTVGKGRPTPKRNQAQAQNLRPLVPADRKASAKRARKRLRERENAEYEAMRTGDLAHMPKSEQIAWRVYIRDYVDARFNIGEFFIPVALVIMIAMMIVVARWPIMYLPLIIALYAYLIIAIIDVVIMWRKLRKKLVQRFGPSCVSRGSRSSIYAWSRAINLRRWRLPKPRYSKRGHWPK